MKIKFNVRNPNAYECALKWKYDQVAYDSVVLAPLDTQTIEHVTTNETGTITCYFEPTDKSKLASPIVTFKVEKETFYLLDSNGNIFETSDGQLFEVA